MSDPKHNSYKPTAEYKLVYAGKESKASVLTNTLEAPLQEMRVFNADNPCPDGWRNMLIFGDNLMALKTLFEDMKEGGPNAYGLRNKIKLIYIDPPFATKQDFMKDKEKAYADKIKGAQFIEFLRKRLIFLREILAEDGSIYVHLDYKKGHYIKLILDEVFGEVNFINEIIWHYFGFKRKTAKNFPRKHDIVLGYGKSGDNRVWNNVYKPHTEKYLSRWKKDENGRLFRDDVNPTGGGKRVIFLDNIDGDLLDSVWSDVPPVNPVAIERMDYPTQKPELLIERLIKASSNKNDVILDCFAGSGSTLSTAEKLQRKWIGIDCGKLSMYTIQARMLELLSVIGNPQPDERKQFERIPNQYSCENSRAFFMVSEKARKGQLNITLDFLQKLHDFLLEVPGLEEFTLICPEEKFLIRDYEEADEGVKIIKKDHITYKISFIEPKAKEPKPKPLKAKSFVLYHAGIYDKEKILQYNWPQYRDFVMKLFGVRPHPHEIHGFKVDGYLGIYPAFVWNYPDRKNVAIDHEYVKQLHGYLNGRAGDRLYIIVPKDSIHFLEDEVRHGETVYTFLKVPASVLIRLIEAYHTGKTDSLGSLKQPRSESDVNEVIDSFGFDFISQPVVDYELKSVKQSHGLLQEDKMIIRLKEFKSQGLLYSPEDFRNFETLSLILLDYNYSGDVFTMDEHIWAADIVKEDVETVDITFDPDRWTEGDLAVILIDVYGNEKSLVFTKKDFIHGRKDKK